LIPRRSLNATDFEKKFRQIRDNYEYTYGPQIADWNHLRDGAKPKTTEGTIARETALANRPVLEYQMRVWVIDGFLDSLNWIQNAGWSNMPPSPNMIPEMSVKSGNKTQKRIDYFGYENDTNRPLLIVEAKRPTDTLPIPIGGANGEPLSSLIAKGLRKEKKLPREWPDWLGSLRDYVNSVKAQTNVFPARAVLTNGEWCVVFRDPEATFSPLGTVRSEDIIVFVSPDDILGRSSEIFSLLEYQIVVGGTEELVPGQLPASVDVNLIDRLAFALKLRYSISPTAGSSSMPIVTVVPIVLARSFDNSWIRISGGSQPRQLPGEYTPEHIAYHLNSIGQDAQQLMAAVRRQMSLEQPLCSIEEHYGNSESFRAHPGVVRSGDCIILFTGTETHFLRQEPSVVGCPFHDWQQCRKEGVQQGEIGVFGKWVETPKAFYESGTLHHCAHRDVFAAKQSQVTPKNRSLCGSRSGDDFQAFCEIAPFEDYLCCRTCVYDKVCEKSAILHLPCETRLVQIPMLSTDQSHAH
jgi:hypothetical protein